MGVGARATHSALRAGRNHPPTHSALRAGPRDRQGSEYRALPVTRLIKTGGEPEPWCLSPRQWGASSRSELHEARVRLQRPPPPPPSPSLLSLTSGLAQLGTPSL